MAESDVPVTFQPLGKTVRVRSGSRLIEAALGAGVPLDLPCGGEGVCGKCRVVVRRGPAEPAAADREVFSPEELAEGFRLACQCLVAGPMTVEIPETSILASHYQILDRAESTSPVPTDPVVSKRYIELPEPRRDDEVADLGRLERLLGTVEVDLPLLCQLPGRLREAKFRGTAVLAERQLIDFEPGDTASECFAVAVDVGTTTLVAMLVDLRTAEELAVVSRLNPQTSFGDDVLSRIVHARQSDENLGQLHRLVVEAVDGMIGELAEAGGVARERIYEMTFSGNTTMQHLLCRIDPRYLGEVPFVPATASAVLVDAAGLGLRIHPRGRAYVSPVIGGFVGGDTVSGILATGLAEADGPGLLVDIGTNGEIVLFADGTLRAAATAAGPAFEGARILHGMRGCAGAIERVTVDGQVRTSVIGGGPPVGLCGSALIDLGAELLRHGIVTPDGRMSEPGELCDDVAPELRGRIVSHDGKAAFLVAAETETATGRRIVLTQRDVRELQLATGAIRAGIMILLRRAGLEPAELERVLIAGGFGNFIRRSRAQRIGLLPPEIDTDRIHYQGNTSLAGARLVALSRRAREQAEELARRTEHVDLSTDPGFQEAFAEAMIFPSK